MIAGTLTLRSSKKMENFNLSDMSWKQIQELEEQLRAEKRNKEYEERQKAKAKLQELAAELGFDIFDLFQINQSSTTTKSGGVRQSPKPKYFHPENNELTWSGRGLKPKWVTAYLAEGGTLEQLMK